MSFNSKNIDVIYRRLLDSISTHGIKEINARTKTGVRVLPGAFSFSLDLSNNRLPVPGNRRYYPHIAAAETAWQIHGTRNPEFIIKYAPKLWSKFVSGGIIEAAYGHRWREAFGRDQFSLMIGALVKDRTSRQVYVGTWDPRVDGLGQDNQPPNIPCPVGFHVYILDNRLNMTVFVRSSDVFVGLPYDVMCYALTMDAIAASVNATPGILSFTLSHAHFYEPQEAAVDMCLKGEHRFWATKEDRPSLPSWSVAKIVKDPEGYIDVVKRMSLRAPLSMWDPKPDVVA